MSKEERKISFWEDVKSAARTIRDLPQFEALNSKFDKHMNSLNQLFMTATEQQYQAALADITPLEDQVKPDRDQLAKRVDQRIERNRMTDVDESIARNRITSEQANAALLLMSAQKELSALLMTHLATAWSTQALENIQQLTKEKFTLLSNWGETFCSFDVVEKAPQESSDWHISSPTTGPTA